MHDTYTIRHADMPQEMRFLLDSYPRDAWEAHPGFQEKTRHWLGAHQMFRRVAERVRLDTEAVLNKDIALGTSKLNYLDPRISVAWAKKWQVPIEKLYSKTQREKFQWAIDMAGKDFVFLGGTDVKKEPGAAVDGDEDEMEEEESFETGSLFFFFNLGMDVVCRSSKKRREECEEDKDRGKIVILYVG